MKKVFSFVLTVIICLSLFAGCSGNRPSDDEAKRALEDALEVLSPYLSGFPASYVIDEEFDGAEFDVTEIITVGIKGMIKTNLEYKDVADKYSEVLCGDLYTNFMNTYFYNENGTLYVHEGGSGGYTMEILEVNYVGEKNGEYTFHVVYDEKVSEGSEFPSREQAEFVLMMSDGKLKLSYFGRSLFAHGNFSLD